MSKPALSQSNINLLTANLYALSDAILVSEADKVAADFRSWLNNNFDLSTEQIAYINTYPELANRYYGYLLAAALLTRSTIVFAAPPDNPQPRRFKETRANLFGEVVYNDDDKELEGSMTVTIEFMLL